MLLRLSNDEEMNIILLRLVEYLGHPNPFVCAVAYSEVCESDLHYLPSFGHLWESSTVDYYIGSTLTKIYN